MLYLARGFAGTRPKEKGKRKGKNGSGRQDASCSSPDSVAHHCSFQISSPLPRDSLHLAWEELFYPTPNPQTSIWLYCFPTPNVGECDQPSCQVEAMDSILSPAIYSQAWNMLPNTHLLLAVWTACRQQCSRESSIVEKSCCSGSLLLISLGKLSSSMDEVRTLYHLILCVFELQRGAQHDFCFYSLRYCFQLVLSPTHPPTHNWSSGVWAQEAPGLLEVF